MAHVAPRRWCTSMTLRNMLRSFSCPIVTSRHYVPHRRYVTQPPASAARTPPSPTPHTPQVSTSNDSQAPHTPKKKKKRRYGPVKKSERMKRKNIPSPPPPLDPGAPKPLTVSQQFMAINKQARYDLKIRIHLRQKAKRLEKRQRKIDEVTTRLRAERAAARMAVHELVAGYIAQQEKVLVAIETEVYEAPGAPGRVTEVGIVVWDLREDAGRDALFGVVRNIVVTYDNTPRHVKNAPNTFSHGKTEHLNLAQCRESISAFLASLHDRAVFVAHGMRPTLNALWTLHVKLPPGTARVDTAQVWRNHAGDQAATELEGVMRDGLGIATPAGLESAGNRAWCAMMILQRLYGMGSGQERRAGGEGDGE
ncbi:uncharacterized protein V1518DRAFT_126523 [Limtongia smithiae]|uniref:uncharacterized protein n=1 Tax=Limtongia smithiae TaxID=1125753 RepID=UPI0034CDF5D5